MTLAEAKANLAALEKFGQDVANTYSKLERAKSYGDPAEIATAQEAYTAAVAAKAEANVSARDIDMAAQVVVDLADAE